MVFPFMTTVAPPHRCKKGADSHATWLINPTQVQSLYAQLHYSRESFTQVTSSKQLRANVFASNAGVDWAQFARIALEPIKLRIFLRTNLQILLSVSRNYLGFGGFWDGKPTTTTMSIKVFLSHTNICTSLGCNDYRPPKVPQSDFGLGSLIGANARFKNGHARVEARVLKTLAC